MRLKEIFEKSMAWIWLGDGLDVSIIGVRVSKPRNERLESQQDLGCG